MYYPQDVLFFLVYSSDLSDAQKKFSDTLQKFEFNCIEGEQTEDEKVIGIVTLLNFSMCTFITGWNKRRTLKCEWNLGKIYHNANILELILAGSLKQFGKLISSIEDARARMVS